MPSKRSSNDKNKVAPAASIVTTTTNAKVEVVSKKSTKSAKKVAGGSAEVQAPVQVAPVTTNTAVEESNGETTDVLLADHFSEFISKLQAISQQMNLLKSDFRVLERKAVRELKSAQKIQAKRKRKNVSRQPSGFVKPTLISDELATFLKKPTGTEMARTEVTREINGYIRANSLQDKDNGRKINPDQHLAKLLKIGAEEELTYFNLQRYMSPHFAKAQSKVTASA